MPAQCHYHVATGLAGYGPDAADSDGFATFESLADALSYARDDLSAFIDFAHDGAHGFASQGDFESAWNEVVRMEDLENWQANLDPARANAPLYRDDSAAYAAMQAEQAAQFPRDVSHNTRLYLWDCAEDPCDCSSDWEG